VFSVWVMSREMSRDELGMGESFGYRAWRVVTRYVTPVAVVLVFLNAIGLISFG